jgi:hypothetical protein
MPTGKDGIAKIAKEGTGADWGDSGWRDGETHLSQVLEGIHLHDEEDRGR